MRTLLAALGGAGIAARFVGGCVRNCACWAAPIDDSTSPSTSRRETVMRALEAADLKVVPTGLKHGTVTAIADGRPFELTTLRRDVETDGRRAVVAFTDDWHEDASRRDFTFNALYADPDGTLYDPFDGRADLAAGRVRFIGDPDTRIAEDRLRVLRFFRFHAWYGQPPLDGASYQACARNAGTLGSLSGERVRKELLRTARGAGRRPTRSTPCARPARSITGCRSMPARPACARWSNARTSRRPAPAGGDRFAAQRGDAVAGGKTIAARRRIGSASSSRSTKRAQAFRAGIFRQPVIERAGLGHRLERIGAAPAPPAVRSSSLAHPLARQAAERRRHCAGRRRSSARRAAAGRTRRGSGRSAARAGGPRRCAGRDRR